MCSSVISTGVIEGVTSGTGVDAAVPEAAVGEGVEASGVAVAVAVSRAGAAVGAGSAGELPQAVRTSARPANTVAIRRGMATSVGREAGWLAYGDLTARW